MTFCANVLVERVVYSLKKKEEEGVIQEDNDVLA